MVYLGVTGLNHYFEANRLSYERSPEGRAEAAREAEQADIQTAETLVQVRLRDPASATFMGAKVVERGKEKAVCGFVNAKNGFGGMAGDQWFAVSGADVIMADDGGDALGRIEHVCG